MSAEGNVFEGTVSKLTIKKLQETNRFLETENSELRARIEDLKESIDIHKNLVSTYCQNSSSLNNKKLDPQAR